MNTLEPKNYIEDSLKLSENDFEFIFSAIEGMPEFQSLKKLMSQAVLHSIVKGEKNKQKIFEDVLKDENDAENKHKELKQKATIVGTKLLFLKRYLKDNKMLNES